MVIRFGWMFALLTVGGYMSGCASEGSRFATGGSSGVAAVPEPVVPTPAPVEPSPPVPVGPGTLTIGLSAEGRPIEAIVLGDGAETVMLLATIHGNEYAGTPLLQKLTQTLRSDPSLTAGRRVVIVPVANPDGYAANIRHNVRGVDLNRNFPAENRQEDRDQYGEAALSEPESLALARLIEQFPPDRVLSIHQPLACVDYDGPGAEAWAKRFAQRCDLPAKKLGGRPGSLGSYLGMTLGVPIVTLELRRHSALEDVDTWAVYGPALIDFVTASAP